MTVQWGEYQPYVPVVPKPMHEATRKEARAEFDKLMAEKQQRTEALRSLLNHNGIELRSSNDGLQELNNWFAREVEPSPDQPTRLQPIWYAVVNDIGLFLGDTMIERGPNLQWVMFDKGQTDMSYQRHVIMGFAQIPNPKYNVDVDVVVASYAHRIVGGKEIDNERFVKMVEEAQKDA